MFNMQDVILDLIKTDDSYLDQNDRNILRLYNNANSEEQSKIDTIFVNLCGYSLGTIINDIYPSVKAKEIKKFYTGWVFDKGDNND